MLTPFAPDIWLVDGPAISAAAGFHYPTRMAVIRLTGGGLFIWSPVAISDELRERVDALGPVAHLVSPNHLHHMSIADWTTAYPDAQLWASPGLAAKRGDLTFDAELGQTPPDVWSADIDQTVFTGNKITQEVVFFHRTSGTVLIADLLQQMPRDWYRGWRRIVAHLDGMTGPTLAMPRKFRLAFSDRASARPAATRLLTWPAQRIVVAHGPPVVDNALTVLREGFGFLAPDI